MNVEVFINENPDRNKWNEFVQVHPAGNIFQTSLMYDVYHSTPNCNAGVIALENSKGSILGLMVYVLIREPGITGYFSNRAIITGGPLIFENNADYLKVLVANYVKRIKKKRPIYTEIRNLSDVKELHSELIGTNFLFQDHLTIHIDLQQSTEQLQNGLHKKRAANIRRAIKKNVIIKDLTSKEELHLAHDLIHKTYERISLPAPPLQLFIGASEIMQKHVKFKGAYLEGKLIGCRVYLIYKNVIYDWYASTDRAFSGFHAADLLPWDTMLWAKQNNLGVYDFAGAGKPDEDYSVRDYKLKFGGALLNFGRYQYIHMPYLYRLGVLGIKIYKYIK
jgi:serine/alanine adding enzyme